MRLTELRAELVSLQEIAAQVIRDIDQATLGDLEKINQATDDLGGTIADLLDPLREFYGEQIALN
jgi:hypothetical protein